MREHIERLKRYLQSEFDSKSWTCCLATVDADGRPTVRTMVLRELSVNGGLLFVSDRRTHKDDHLRDRPFCEVCFWLPRQNVQARVRGEAVVVDAMDDESMRQEWWHRIGPRGTQSFTDGKGADPDEIDMPTTFELITVTPTWIEIGDHSTYPAQVSTWKGG